MMLERLREWLGEHQLTAVSDFERHLNTAATPDQLAELEAILDCSLPEEFTAVYRVADGMQQHVHFSPWLLLSTDEIATCHSAMQRVDVYDELASKCTWNVLWIPFATDRAGDWLCLDLCQEDAWEAEEQPYGLDTQPCLRIGMPKIRSLALPVPWKTALSDGLKTSLIFPLNTVTQSR